MSDYVTPCATAPEDWFVERDGKQYADDELVTDDQVARMVASCEETGVTMPVEQAREMLEATALKKALTRRRHAKDECHTNCYVRTQCLGLALADNAPTYGTWGGYYQEELRKIRDLRDERRADSEG